MMHPRDFYFFERQIPSHMHEAVMAYVQDRLQPGDFLMAVLQNDLTEAVGCADEKNMWALPVYVAYLYNHAPRKCWGSPEAVKQWLSQPRKTTSKAKEEHDAH